MAGENTMTEIIHLYVPGLAKNSGYKGITQSILVARTPAMSQMALNAISDQFLSWDEP
jgi:hypothetical protein